MTSTAACLQSVWSRESSRRSPWLWPFISTTPPSDGLFEYFSPSVWPVTKVLVFTLACLLVFFPNYYTLKSYSEPNVELSWVFSSLSLLHLTWQLQQSWKYMYRSVVFVLQKSEYNWEKCGLALLTWVWFLGSSLFLFLWRLPSS